MAGTKQQTKNESDTQSFNNNSLVWCINHSPELVLPFAGRRGNAGSHGAELLRRQVYLCYCIIEESKHTVTPLWLSLQAEFYSVTIQWSKDEKIKSSPQNKSTRFFFELIKDLSKKKKKESNAGKTYSMYNIYLLYCDRFRLTSFCSNII